MATPVSLVRDPLSWVLLIAIKRTNDLCTTSGDSLANFWLKLSEA